MRGIQSAAPPEAPAIAALVTGVEHFHWLAR